MLLRAPRRETQGQAVTTLAAWPRNCFRVHSSGKTRGGKIEQQAITIIQAVWTEAVAIRARGKKLEKYFRKAKW